MDMVVETSIRKQRLALLRITDEDEQPIIEALDRAYKLGAEDVRYRYKRDFEWGNHLPKIPTDRILKECNITIYHKNHSGIKRAVRAAYVLAFGNWNSKT
jgi:hypothetical protein